MTKYFKTIIPIEVLSIDEPYSFTTYENLAYDVIEGHFSGMVLDREVAELSKEQMAEALIAQGSDVEFLIWTEDVGEINDSV